MSYEAVFGVEVHTQLATNTKAWCNCEIKVNGFENHYVCEICSAQPGTLPVLNKKSVKYALRLAHALECKKINRVSYFDRKNYFYPDLPKGYQITQYHTPIAENGMLEGVEIERIQLEEDTGKSSHEGENSLINLNRAGTPLIEIVSKTIEGGDASVVLNYLKSLHQILKYTGVSHANMQDGNFRCDINISLRKKGSKEYGTRTETKNLNSFRSVEKAIEYEFERQSKILDAGEKVLQQTLLFDVETQKTKVLRTKTDADDYRYYLEPDLLPLIITEAEIKKAKDDLPELPAQKVIRFQSEYEIREYDAVIIARSLSLANYFEECCKHYQGDKKKVANWVLGDLLGLANEANIEFDKLNNITPKSLVNLMGFVDRDEISGKVAKDVLLEMFDTGKSAGDIIEAKGLKQNNDSSELETIVKELIEKHPKEVEELKGGRDRVMGFFVGQVMKKTKGQGNPKITSELVKKLLGL